ncbi:hypothetical protein C0581_05145 [Candidatus Parcubacteria bacterium]|nr:MAG: hypothetical protein C0581_05145 [Candidatus Parcubacteria bacterium]
MKIGIDASRANETQKTGVGWYAYHVIQELKKQTPRDVEVVLYTNKPLQGDLADLPSGWTQKVLKWSPKRLWTQVRLSWEMLLHRPDVLFIPAHVFPLIHPKKTVMTVHDIAAITFPGSYSWFERWYSVWSARVALKKLWKIITPSEFTKSELESLKVRKFKSDKIHVIHHGYDKRYSENENKVEIEKALDKYGLKKPFLMSIGRLEEKKNTVRIIKAFEKLRLTTENLQLILIGNPGHGYDKVKKVIDNSKYKEDIITPGWVDNNDLPILMSGAEVFVFPSLYEGFGIPVLESLASGTPVVTSKGSCLEEVGGDVCIYVDPADVDSIVHGISDAFDASEIRIQQGLKHTEGFSWEKCAKKTLETLLS